MKEAQESESLDQGHNANSKRYTSYVIIFLWEKNKKNKDNMRPSHSKHCVYAFAISCAISYVVLLMFVMLWAYDASQWHKHLIALIMEWILRGWRFGTSKRWRCPSAYLVVLILYIYIYMLECMFDATTCDKTIGMGFIVVKAIVRDQINQIQIKDAFHMPKLLVSNLAYAIQPKRMFCKSLRRKNLCNCTTWRQFVRNEF